MDQEKVMKIDLDKVLRARVPGVYRFLPHSLVKWLERLICQNELNELLQANCGKTGAEFCKGVLDSLDVTVEWDATRSLPDPANRRVILVSNHPLGGLDGLALTYLVQKHYGGQVWFVVNDLLMAVKPLENVFLPINKFGGQSREAMERLDATLAGGDPIIIFPAGICSRYRKVDFIGESRKMVCDLRWQKSFVTQARKHQRDIVPLYFDGANSMKCYRCANLRKRLGIPFNLEQVLLPGEMVGSRGRKYTVSVGNTIPYADLFKKRDARGMADSIQSEVYHMKCDASPHPVQKS